MSSTIHVYINAQVITVLALRLMFAWAPTHAMDLTMSGGWISSSGLIWHDVLQ